MQRHLSASKPGDAGKLFFGGHVGAPISSGDEEPDRRSGSQGDAIDFDRSMRIDAN